MGPSTKPTAAPAGSAPSFALLVRTGGIVFAGYVAIALVGIVALRLYTQLASPRVFGEANLLLSAWSLGLQLLVAPFTSTQLRYHAESEERGDGDEFTSQALYWALRGGGALAVLTTVGAAVWSSVHRQAAAPLIVAAAVVWPLATTARNVFLSRLNAERRQRLYIGLQVIEAVALVGFTSLALLLMPVAGSYLLGQALAPCLTILALALLAPWPLRARPAGSRRDTEFAGRARSYGAPFAMMSLFGWLSNLSDRYVLAFLLGAGTTGSYIAPFTIASRALTISNTAMTDLFRPLLFAAEGRGDSKLARQVFRRWVIVHLAVSALAVAAFAAAGKLMVPLLLAKQYRGSAYAIILWIAAAYAVYGLTQVLENRILSLGRSSLLLRSMIVGAVANIGLSLVLISRNGLVGAAEGNCISFVVQAFVTLALLRFYASMRSDVPLAAAAPQIQ